MKKVILVLSSALFLIGCAADDSKYKEANQTPPFGKAGKLRFPGISQRTGRRAANSARCPAFDQAIRPSRIENSRSAGRRPRRPDFNPPVLARDPEKLSARRTWSCWAFFPRPGWRLRNSSIESSDWMRRNWSRFSSMGCCRRCVRRQAGADSIWRSVFCPIQDAIVARNLAAAGVKRVIACSPSMRPEVHAVFQLADVLDQLGLTLHDPVPRLSVGPKTAELVMARFPRGQRFSPKELANRSIGSN